MMGQHRNKIFRFIKSLKNTKSNDIPKLTVGNSTYHGDQVADGFYYSMSALKNCDMEGLKAVPELADKLLDYEVVRSLCQHYQGIPPTWCCAQST